MLWQQTRSFARVEAGRQHFKSKTSPASTTDLLHWFLARVLGRRATGLSLEHAGGQWLVIPITDETVWNTHLSPCLPGAPTPLLRLIVEGDQGRLTRRAGALTSTCAARAEQGSTIRAGDKMY